MAGHLNLRRKIDGPHSHAGRVLVEHIATGHVFSVTPTSGWHEDGRDWVTLAFADPGMQFRILRDEIASRETIAKVDPADEPPVSYFDA